MSQDLHLWADKIKQGDRQALSQAITLIESVKASDQELAGQLLPLLPRNSYSKRIAFSGPAGVGKSTFIEKYGLFLTKQGHKVAVLSIDPSSAKTGGSLLADKTRMPLLSLEPQAYIRPSPSSGFLGGIGQHTRQAIELCEAAGYDMILVETMGVGQSEIMVSYCVDLFILMLLPGGGDQIQGLKKGIMEYADIIVINKADGDLRQAAEHMQIEFSEASKILPHDPNQKWKVPLILSSSEDEEAKVLYPSQKVYNLIDSYFLNYEPSPKREEQLKFWFKKDLSQLLLDNVISKIETSDLVNQELRELQDNKSSYHRSIKSVLSKITFNFKK